MTLQEIIDAGIPQDSDAIVVLQPKEQQWQRPAASEIHVTGYPYRTKTTLAAELGISRSTVYDRMREIEGQIGKRYGAYALIHDGNIVLVNVLVFLDWLKYRRQLTDKNMAKYVPAFSPKKVAEQMGWDMTKIREYPKEMVV